MAVETLDQLYHHLEERSDLEPKQRGQMRSALNTFSGFCQEPLSALPASSSALRSRFDRLHHAKLNVSKKYVSNTKTNVRRALDLVQDPNLRRVTLSPIWSEVQDLLDNANRADLSYKLSSFMRYGSLFGILPESVSNASVDEFRQYIERTEPQKHPNAAFRSTCHAWNEAADRVPAFPGSRVDLPSDRSKTLPPLKEFPESFKNDLCRMERDLQSPPLHRHDLHALSPRTIEGYVANVRRCAQWLVKNGYIDKEDITSVATVSRSSLSEKYIRDKFDGDRAHGKKNALTVAIAIKKAAVWSGLPESEITTLNTINRNVRPKHNSITRTNRERLRQLDDETNQRNFKSLPAILSNQASTKGLKTKSAKVDLTIAAATAILLHAPVRIGTLRQLKLSHIVWQRGNENGGYLCIPPEIVKNGQPLTFLLSERALNIIEQYLRHARPTWLSASDDLLFPWHDKKRDNSYLRENITKKIYQAIGLHINPHLFRHIAAKLYLDRNPNDFETISIVLGHKKIETTYTFYYEFNQFAAIHTFDSVVFE